MLVSSQLFPKVAQDCIEHTICARLLDCWLYENICDHRFLRPLATFGPSRNHGHRCPNVVTYISVVSQASLSRNLPSEISVSDCQISVQRSSVDSLVSFGTVGVDKELCNEITYQLSCIAPRRERVFNPFHPSDHGFRRYDTFPA
jgi:hypothetical protein